LVEKLLNGEVEEFWALKNINLVINRGERVGIVGLNGCGKTTLLKIISGITSPTKGHVQIYGNVVSLIDLEAGFHTDLSGYANVFINGMLLGMSKSEINQKINSIIEYSGIGKFIDVPLFTYSAGMKLRLGFSVAIFSNPEIIVIDEGLSVGDMEFQKLIRKKFFELNSNGCTFIYVSHSMESIKMYCKRFVWLEQGEIKNVDSRFVLKRYQNNPI